MTPVAIRNTVLPLLALAIAATVHLPKRLTPQIQCSPNVQEGQTYWCSVNLAYPPDQPDYSWTVDGGCQAKTWSGQTIQLEAVPGKGSECRVNAIVRDGPNGPIVGKPNEERIEVPTITGLDATQSLGSTPPQIGAGRLSRPPESLPRLLSFDSPDEKLRAHADSAVVQGQVDGLNLGAYIIAFYTQTPAGWSLQQGPVTIDPATRMWEVKTHFGSAYAAVLARKSFRPEPSLQSLPRRGNGVIDVKASN